MIFIQSLLCFIIVVASLFHWIILVAFWDWLQQCNVIILLQIDFFGFLSYAFTIHAPILDEKTLIYAPMNCASSMIWKLQFQLSNRVLPMRQNNMFDHNKYIFSVGFFNRDQDGVIDWSKCFRNWHFVPFTHMTSDACAFCSCQIQNMVLKSTHNPITSSHGLPLAY